MSRPKVNDIDKRIFQVNIRLTETEHAKAVAHAQASGMTPANWIRRIVFTGKFPPLKLSPVEAALYRELKRIGVNLNQITHRINLREFPKEYLAQQVELKEALDYILKALTSDGEPDQG
ncbi:plasmid mobilization protein [Chryseolinea lacunae]|uniref:plasmid mobilization protein n=1 Tax=Chryseolinea lacunae TaxID=2801331 RepID=UPI003F70631C